MGGTSVLGKLTFDFWYSEPHYQGSPDPKVCIGQTRGYPAETAGRVSVWSTQELPVTLSARQ